MCKRTFDYEYDDPTQTRLFRCPKCSSEQPATGEVVYCNTCLRDTLKFQRMTAIKEIKKGDLMKYV